MMDEYTKATMMESQRDSLRAENARLKAELEHREERFGQVWNSRKEIHEKYLAWKGIAEYFQALIEGGYAVVTHEGKAIYLSRALKRAKELEEEDDQS